MTADIRQLMTDCERLGYCLLTYRRGCFYVAGYGLRDVPWCKRVVRMNIPARGKMAS